MNTDEFLSRLASSQPQTFAVPEGAVICPGTGPSIFAGMVIASWSVPE